MKKVILIFVLVPLLSCSSDDNADFISRSLVGKSYVFPLVSSQEECDQLLSNGVNCFQEVAFLNQQSARVIVTDIINPGRYRVQGNRIIITVENGDTENPVIFEFNDDLNELRRVSDNSSTVWKLQVPGVLPWDL